jgi:hypothetical protein
MYCAYVSELLSGCGHVEQTYLASSDGLHNGLLNVGGLRVETHVSQHHDGGEKQSSGVSELLASDIRGGSVDSLEDRALVTNVTGRGKTKTTDQTGAHVGENVSVQVGHDENLVVVGKRIGDHFQAGVVEELSVKLNVGVLLGELTCSAEEKTIGHLHDGGLVNSANLLPANVTGVLEGVTEDALGSLAGDELDGLDDAINNDVLDAGVLALGVLTDQNGVDVVVGGLEALDRPAGTDVGEEVEGTAERQVEGNVTLADGGSEGTLEGDVVPVDALDGLVGDDRLAVGVQAGCDIAGLPLDGHVCGRVDVLDRLSDLRANTVTLDERDGVLAVVALGALELGDLRRRRGIGAERRLVRMSVKLPARFLDGARYVREHCRLQRKSSPVRMRAWPGAGIGARGRRKSEQPAF